jgi:hypothetical protein
MTLFSKSVAALALSLSAIYAHASVVTFSDTKTTFADGSYSAGFYPLGSRDNATRAYNDSGSDVSVDFNAPVWLTSVTLLAALEVKMPDQITVTLYDAANTVLGSETLDVFQRFFFPPTTFTFNTANVSSVAFSLGWIDTPAQPAYFQVEDITYSFDAPSGDVPEPASLALFGLGACAVAAVRRKRAARA